MIFYVFIIFLYFGIGAIIACANCVIHDTPIPPDMSEEDKNVFTLIVAFWAILIPGIFVKRLYIAIRALLAKDKNN